MPIIITERTGKQNTSNTKSGGKIKYKKYTTNTLEIRESDDEGLFATGKHKFEQYNRIKIYAGTRNPLHSDAQKASI